jgi:hypothetical protein
MTISFPNNRVHFPITQALACSYNSRPLVNTYTLFLIFPRLS